MFTDRTAHLAMRRAAVFGDVADGLTQDAGRLHKASCWQQLFISSVGPRHPPRYWPVQARDGLRRQSPYGRPGALVSGQATNRIGAFSNASRASVEILSDSHGVHDSQQALRPSRRASRRESFAFLARLLTLARRAGLKLRSIGDLLTRPSRLARPSSAGARRG